MYFWVLLLKINRILSLVQLLYDQNVSKFIINGNCFKKKKKKKNHLWKSFLAKYINWRKGMYNQKQWNIHGKWRTETWHRDGYLMDVSGVFLIFSGRAVFRGLPGYSFWCPILMEKREFKLGFFINRVFNQKHSVSSYWQSM